MFEARSALAGVMPGSGRDGADGRRRVRLGEAPLGSLVQVGLYRAGAPPGAVPAIVGGPLPESPAAAARIGAHLVFRIAADQWWVQTTDTTLAGRLRAGLSSNAASVTPLDGARACIVIEGPAGRELLGRLVAVDVDPSVFGVECFAQTPIHQVGGLLHRARTERYEFIALRSFAASAWEVIEDAARFFGYELLE